MQWLARAPLDDGLDRVVLYDGGCGFCTRWKEWAERRRLARLRFSPCQREAKIRRSAGISDAHCEESAFLVVLRGDEPLRVHSGAAAINAALARFQGARNVFWRWLGLFYAVPGLRQVENLVYRWVAKNRHRFGSGSCSVEEMRQQSVRR